MNAEPAAIFAREARGSASSIAQAVIDHASVHEPASNLGARDDDDDIVRDDRPTRRQPALELLALHQASALGGMTADDLAVPIARDAAPADARPEQAASIADATALYAESARAAAEPPAMTDEVARVPQEAAAHPDEAAARVTTQEAAAHPDEAAARVTTQEAAMADEAAARVTTQEAAMADEAAARVTTQEAAATPDEAAARVTTQEAAAAAARVTSQEAAATPDEAAARVTTQEAAAMTDEAAAQATAEQATTKPGEMMSHATSSPVLDESVPGDATQQVAPLAREAIEDAAPAPDAGASTSARAELPAAASPPEPSAERLSTTINAIPKEVDEAHTEQVSTASAMPTTRTPALEPSARADRLAAERGLRPLTKPGDESRHRRWLIATTAFSVACLVVTASVVVWARGEVRRARAASRAASPLVASTAVVEMPAQPTPASSSITGSTARIAPAPPSAPGSPIAPPSFAPAAPPASPSVGQPTGVAGATTCSIRVTTNVDAATVWIDGIPHGTAPAEVPVECGIDTLVELRHPRYQDFKRTLSVSDGTLEVDASLEREKTELTVWSDPPGATVTYNGRTIGKTPLVTKVNRFEQGTLWFRAPGRVADWRKILPKEATKTVSVKLKPRR